MFYGRVLKHVGDSLDLPVKRCIRCRVVFVPDYRTAGHQKCCPYGCVEDNHRRNVRAARKRYRGKREVRIARSLYNREYRRRRKQGEVEAKPPRRDEDKDVSRLNGQIIGLYRLLRPGVGEAKLAQLARILDRVSEKTKSEGDRVWIRLAAWSRIGRWP